VIHIAQRPALTRVVVDLPAGARLGSGESDVEATDADPADGRAVVRVTAAALSVRGADVRGAGVRVRLRPRRGGFTALVDAAPRSLKFVSYRTTGSGRRLVIDLWRNTTARSARILNDGCLRLDAWGARVGAARARGRELTPLFEHGLVLSLRQEDNPTPIAERPLIATEGTFRPDFSGYSVPGRWSGRLSFSLIFPGPPVPVRAMLEAWSTSAKDGSLDCLVQTPVVIRP
jgi:hypothetical protein